MNETKKTIEDSKNYKLSSKKAKNNVADKKDEFVIPFEAACSPEFEEGCILRKDEEDMDLRKSE